MCKIIEDMRTEKELETRLDDIKSLMETLKFTVQQAMDALRIPASEQAIYLTKLK